MSFLVHYQSTMLRLSNDLLLMILEVLYSCDEDFFIYGEKRDLLACRETCRRLGALGQCGAFSHVTFRHSTEGYERLLEMSRSSNVRLKVRYLTGYFMKLESDLTHQRFAEAQSRDQAEEHNIDMFQKYDSHKFLEDNSIDVASLAVALTGFRELHTVRVLGDPRNTQDGWTLPDGGYTNSHARHGLFMAFTTALYVARLSVERLVLGLFPRSNPAEAIQGYTHVRQKLYRTAFYNLKCLELRLSTATQGQESVISQGGTLNYKGILSLIRSAPNLEELRLEFDVASQTSIPSLFIDSLQIPKLRVLRLATIFFQDSSCLVQFCSRHAETLKVVELSELCLQTGSWETVFTAMRETTHLDSIVLSGQFLVAGSAIACILVGGVLLEEPVEEVRIGQIRLVGEVCRVVVDERIENFVQGETDHNPFDAIRSSMDSLSFHKDIQRR